MKVLSWIIGWAIGYWLSVEFFNVTPSVGGAVFSFVITMLVAIFLIDKLLRK